MTYFAYGSNMNEERMKERDINFTSRQFAKLTGYVLAFNKKAKAGNYTFANIKKSEIDCVEGILYEFPDNDILKLDKAEGYPYHYNKIEIIVFDKDENPIKAITYIAQKDKVVEGLFPTTNYINHLLAGKDILSNSYIEKLLNTQTLNL